MFWTHYALLMDKSIIWYFLGINFVYILLLSVSFIRINRYFRWSAYQSIAALIDDEVLPEVTVLVPAHNESEYIVHAILSLMNSTYKNNKICIVDDGSTDDTVKKLKERFQLKLDFPNMSCGFQEEPITGYFTSETYPGLRLLKKERSGKGNSMNIGLYSIHTPLFLTFDADSIIDPDSIRHQVLEMNLRTDTVVLAGSVNVLNGFSLKDGKMSSKRKYPGVVPSIQICEYTRAFLFGRLGWNYFGGNLILPGALTLFDLPSVKHVNGFDETSLSEDMEIVLHLRTHMNKKGRPCKVHYIPDAAAYTWVPSNMNRVCTQRIRWHRGLLDNLLRYKGMFFNPRYKVSGIFSFPFHVVGEFLAPIIELLGYVTIIVLMQFQYIDWFMAVLFFIATAGLALIIGLASILLELIVFRRRHSFFSMISFFAFSLLENFGYRQVVALSRATNIITYIPVKLIRYFSRKKYRREKTWISW